MNKDQLMNQEQTEQDNSRLDYLTGLLNVEGFLELAEEEKKKLMESGESPVILFLNLDGLKFFNRKYGFQEGNRLLQAFGRLITRFFPDELCSRFGQDHFIILTTDDSLKETLQKLFEECKKINNGNNLPARVGIYPFRTEDITVDAACDRAKLACDTLSSTYRSGYCYFDSSLEATAVRHQYVIENIDRAISEGWIRTYFQPIIRTANGMICAEEALSRWEDPVYGLMMPADFIPPLEEAGLIYKLDLYVVEQVLKFIHELEGYHVPIIPKSVNLSRADFDSCDIVEEIRSRVDAAGADRDEIVIELTETMIGRDYDFMKEQIGRFRELGFAVWMDDFGSGYSTLNLLQSIEVDLLKLDMQLTQSFEASERGRIILTELMKLALSLGMDTICEGVETEEEMQFLREIGCEKLQGYYYQKPIEAEKILEQCRQGRSIGVEEKQDALYYNAIGRINLYDLSAAAELEVGGSHHYFNMVPMALIEVKDDMIRFIRTNQTYRDFAIRTVGHDLSDPEFHFSVKDKNYTDSFIRYVAQCGNNKTRAFITGKMRDKTTVHSLVRWIADNPSTGGSAVAVIVLAAMEDGQEATYESIARTLASDYFRLYYVDLDTEQFIEYSSGIGWEELSVERHGEDFFQMIRKDARERIFEEDIENFVFSFTRENIERALREQGTFTLTYRQNTQDGPVHVNLKAMQMQGEENKLVIGISMIEEQVKLQDGYERSVISNAISGTEAARIGTASLDTVSFVVKACVKLMETGDFTEHIRDVLKDISDYSQADAVRILLLDPKNETTQMFAEAFRGGVIPEKRQQITNLPYAVVAGWERLTGENNAIIIENEEDMNRIEKEDPFWIDSMRGAGLSSLVLVPLRRSDHTLGYIYVTNFNTRKTGRIKELVELVSFFISSEIENYLVRIELETLSNFDELTGLKNRYAMLTRVRKREKEEAEDSFGLLTMDLNGLKRLNDTEGHFAGDALIIRTANFLREALGEEDLYRIGGDEFIKIYPGISKEEYEEKTDLFRKEAVPESGISLAIGTAWSAASGDAESVFYVADQNMYADKKAFYDRHPELKAGGR